jgi:ribosomal protein S16
MVKIRLMRAGAKNRPYYRLIAIDERAPRDGRKLEELGTYADRGRARRSSRTPSASEVDGRRADDAGREGADQARQEARGDAARGCRREPGDGLAMAEKSASELVEFIAKGIVGQPDAVRVNSQEGGRMLELVTSDEDRGRVIGRQGRVAKAIRAVLSASRAGRDVRLDIVD